MKLLILVIFMELVSRGFLMSWIICRPEPAQKNGDEVLLTFESQVIFCSLS